MKNIRNNLEAHDCYLDKIQPNLNLWRAACNKLLIMDFKWPNLSLSKQRGWSQEIDGGRADVCRAHTRTRARAWMREFKSPLVAQ